MSLRAGDTSGLSVMVISRMSLRCRIVVLKQSRESSKPSGTCIRRGGCMSRARKHIVCLEVHPFLFLHALFTRQLTRMPRPSKSIDVVGDGEQWVAEQHTWPGITHDFFRLLPIMRLVAMHRAVRARRLVLTIRAFLEAYFGIVEERGAVLTELVARIVEVRTVNADHFAHGPEFTLQVPGCCCHVCRCLGRTPIV